MLTRRHFTLLLAAASAVYLILTAGFHALAARQAAEGQPPAVTDFNTFYAVALLLTEGQSAALAYDTERLYPYEVEAVKRSFATPLNPEQERSIPRFGWYYPPTFLLILTWMDALPYWGAWAVWVAASFIPFAWALRRITGDPLAMAAGFAYPGSLITTMFGQNGFLTGGLLGLGLSWLNARPLLAGMLIGLASIKPQLGLLVPVALLAGRHWKVIATATLTVLALAGLSWAIFGAETWQAFLAGSSRATALMEHKAPWMLMPSTFAMVRLLGGAVPLAYGLHAIVAVIAASVVAWAWWRPGPEGLKAAILCTATLLATPFGYSYDLILLALPIAWLAMAAQSNGWRPGERLAAVAAVLLPFATSALANASRVQVGPLVLSGLLVVLALRLRRP